MIYPPSRPPINEVHGPGDFRCRWGRCEAGGWILATAPAVYDEHGGGFHPGCRAAMLWANQPHSADGDPAGPEACRAPGAAPNRCAYGDCQQRCRYVVQ